jgi:Tat protein translocase TatB subunit
LLLFIFESIGTSELILVGIVALMFLGPRKLPELARKAGKMMAEFRGTASEFKETWQREVNFEEEAKLLNIKDLDNEHESDAPLIPQVIDNGATAPLAPSIKAADPSLFRDLVPVQQDPAIQNDTPAQEIDENDKRNWL